MRFHDRGIISLIIKDNKSRSLYFFRPISPFNCVYKIAFGTIANIIKSELHKLIHDTQTGFISGRFKREHIRKLLTLCKQKQNNIPGLLPLLFDFEKAFDSLSWFFIQNVLTF